MYAVMFIERAVLDGDYRVDEVFREFLKSYGVAFDGEKLTDQVSVSVVDLRWYFGLEVLKLRNIGYIIEGGNKYSQSGTEYNGKKEENDYEGFFEFFQTFHICLFHKGCLPLQPRLNVTGNDTKVKAKGGGSVGKDNKKD